MAQRPPSSTPDGAPARASERRRGGRLQCVLTTCQFGDVVDLSRTGAKVVSRKPIALPEGRTVNLKLEAPGGAMLVPSRPVSCRKRPDGRYDVGFEFHFTDEAMTRAIVALARTALDCHEYKPRAA